MYLKEYSKQYYLKNKERLNAKARANYFANREARLQKCKERHKINRERHLLTSKIGHYKRKFGLTLEQRNEILSKGCQICFGTATHIDHCHKTNKVRGGLCNNCNTGLGMFNDSQTNLINALQYVSAH